MNRLKCPIAKIYFQYCVNILNMLNHLLFSEDSKNELCVVLFSVVIVLMALFPLYLYDLQSFLNKLKEKCSVYFNLCFLFLKVKTMTVDIFESAFIPHV